MVHGFWWLISGFARRTGDVCCHNRFHFRGDPLRTVIPTGVDGPAVGAVYSNAEDALAFEDSGEDRQGIQCLYSLGGHHEFFPFRQPVRNPHQRTGAGAVQQSFPWQSNERADGCPGIKSGNATDVIYGRARG